MRIERIEENRKLDFLPLLLLGDEDEGMIGRYLSRGELFALYDDDLRAVCVVTREAGGDVELKNLAVSPEHQRKGYGRAMVDFVTRRYRHPGRFLYAGTGDSPLTLGFYQRCGFCYSHTVKNFFTDNYPRPIIECGKQLTDMIYLKKPLSTRRVQKEEAMKATEAMFARHSYRGRYLEEPVPREDLTLIMQAGLAAPSGCNMQTTSLIAVDDPALLKRLHGVIRPALGETAPAMICVLTRRLVAYADRCFATQDYAAAIQNMLLAAVELGYQSCWCEGHITDKDRIGRKMADILGVPQEYELVCFLPIGIPGEAVTAPAKKPFAERAWFNGFQKA